MDNDLNGSQWLNSEEAARYLRISVSRLHNLTSLGHVKYYKLGRSNRYRPEDLDKLMISKEFLEEQRVRKLKEDTSNN